MAILSQCEHCLKYVKSAYGMKCKSLGRTPVLNEKECPDFADSEKKEEVKPQVEKNNEPVFATLAETIKYASEQKIKYKVSDEFLRKDLSSKGVPLTDLESVMDKAQLNLKRHNRDTGLKEITYGIIGIAASFLYAILTYFLFIGAGSILAYGIFLWGVIELVKGIVRIIRNRS